MPDGTGDGGGARLVEARGEQGARPAGAVLQRRPGAIGAPPAGGGAEAQVPDAVGARLNKKHEAAGGQDVGSRGHAVGAGSGKGCEADDQVEARTLAADIDDGGLRQPRKRGDDCRPIDVRGDGCGV